MHKTSLLRLLRLFLVVYLLSLLAGCFGDGRGDKFISDTSGTPAGKVPVDSIQDGGFEPPGVPDASGGNVDVSFANFGDWSSFNSNFLTSNLGPSSAPVSHDAGGTQSLIQFGVDAGAENVIEALEGDFVELSAWAMSWRPDPFNNLAILQLTFWDSPGGRAGNPGEEPLRTVQLIADSVGDQYFTLLPQDGAEVTDWTEMTLSAFAPVGTRSAQVLLLHVLDPNTPNTGALYWDDVRLTSTRTGEPFAALSITKTASQPTYENVDEVISYSYRVTNSGSLTVGGPISVVDDNVDAAPTCPAGDLATGASITCTASRTVTQNDLDAGSITNVAYASGTDPGSGNEVRSPTDTVSINATSDPEFQLVWEDNFDDWCGEGICPPNPNNWTIETGYGPNNDGWGNNEWQLYTPYNENDPENSNLRVEGDNLVITATCGDGTPAEGYFQDFEGMDADLPSALADDGYTIFADVWGSVDGDATVGEDILLYSYGPFPAPNGGDGFSAVATGEGGAAQGAQYLNVYSDYANQDQAPGGACGPTGCTINTSVFQESIIDASNIGETWTLSFDAKSPFENGIFDAAEGNGGDINNPQSASAFIKTLDPNAGFATTNDIRADMTDISNTDWDTFSISLDFSDPLLEGQILQFGFNTVSSLYDNSGVLYDNISFSKDSAEPPPECIGPQAVRGGSITSGKVNTLNSFTFRYGKVEARIKPPVGKGTWPAFWMLGENFPDVGWPFTGEIDVMELFDGLSNEYTTHFTIHWCDETAQDPTMPDVCFPQDKGWTFTTDSLSFFPDSLGDDYHTFSMEWDEDGIAGFIDGINYFNANIDPATMEEFLEKFYMILNVAMGGTLGSNNQPPDGTETWPYTMYVDWVRVYQKINP